MTVYEIGPFDVESYEGRDEPGFIEGRWYDITWTGMRTRYHKDPLSEGGYHYLLKKYNLNPEQISREHLEVTRPLRLKRLGILSQAGRNLSL